MKPTRPGLALALIALPIFVGALDLTVVSAVLPHVILDLEIPLQTGLDDAAWMVTGYLLAYSISMTFMGRLSDLIGRRQVYLAALAIFALGSYLVAVADTWPTDLILRVYGLVASGRPDISFVKLYMLIAARMIQAFGAGTMVPVGMAMVGDLYPIGQRARPLGLIAAVDTAGWVVGHLYGGIVVRFFDWRMIFWLNLPLCLLAAALLWLALRGIKQERSPGRMDWLGAALVTGTLTLLNLGFGGGSEASMATEAQPIRVSLLAAAAALLVLFLWHQAHTKHPLLDLKLFRLPNFAPASLMNFMVGFSLFVAIANVPLFINSLIAITAEQGAWDSGWMLSGLTVPLALASVPGGWLTDKRGYRLPTLLGLGIAVVGFFLMGTWRAETNYTVMAAHLAVTGVGLGLTFAPIAAAVINVAPPDQRGTSSGLVIIFRLIGMTVGVSSITAYGLQRAERLGQQLLDLGAGLAETARVGITVMERVISETFWIAGIIVLAAMLPALAIKNNLETGVEEVRKDE